MDLLTGVRWPLSGLLIRLSWVISDIEHLVTCLMTISNASLEDISILIFGPFSSWVVCLVFRCPSMLHVLEMRTLLILWFANIFPHPEGCLFLSLRSSLVVQILLSLTRSCSLTFGLFFHYSRRWNWKQVAPIDVVYTESMSRVFFSSRTS